MHKAYVNHLKSPMVGAYPEGLPGFSLLPRLLDLLSPHLFLVLPLSNTVVVLKSEQNIKAGQLSKLRIRIPIIRLSETLIGFTPAGENIHVEIFKERNHFGGSS